MTSIHLALACGYVRSLARMRTWGEFSHIAPRKDDVKMCFRVKLISLSKILCTKKPLNESKP